MSLRLPRLKLQHKAFFALAVLLVALLLVFLGFRRSIFAGVLCGELMMVGGKYWMG